MTLLCLCSAAQAQVPYIQVPYTQVPYTQVPYVGVLSAVDIGARPGAEKEAGRTAGLGTVLPGQKGLPGQEVRPLVELIHVQNLVACRGIRAAAPHKTGSLPVSPPVSPPVSAVIKCPQYEWSVPFIPEESARALEEELSRAWNEFDARSTWYMNSLLNSNPDPGLGLLGGLLNFNLVPTVPVPEVTKLAGTLLPFTQGKSLLGNCGTNARARADRYVNAWNVGTSGVPVSLDRTLFCDDLKAAVSPVPSYPLGQLCASIDAVTSWPEVSRRWAAGYTQAVGVYYPQYWQQVYAAIEKYMPGSLAWDGVYPLTGPVGTVGGAQLQPVYASGRRPAQYQALALKAQMQDAGGAAYMLRRYPYPGLVGSKLPAAVSIPVPGLPKSGGLGSTWPGVSKLEVLKYGLSTREDIFSRPDQWWSLNPQLSPVPLGPTGAGDLRETEGVGAVSFMQLYSRVDSPVELTSPRAAEYQRWCFLSYAPPVPALVTRTFPGVSQSIATTLGGLTRVHVRWETVPEGYPLHHVRGLPSDGLLGLKAKLTGLLPTVNLPQIAQTDVRKFPLKQVMAEAQAALQGQAEKALSNVVVPQLLAALPGQAGVLPRQTAPAVKPAVPAVKSKVPTAATRPAPGNPKPAPGKTVIPGKKITPAPGGTDSGTGGVTYSEVRVKPGLGTIPFSGKFPQGVSSAPTAATAPRTAVSGCERATGTEALRKCLAAKILKTLNISLSSMSSTRGGSPAQNMVDTARGLAPMRGCGPGSPNCGQRHILSVRLLEAMLKMADKDQYFVTALTGGGHGSASSHYSGEAIDLGTFEGIYLGVTGEGHRAALNACLSAGAKPGQSFNGFNDADHRDHVHCDFRP